MSALATAEPIAERAPALAPAHSMFWCWPYLFTLAVLGLCGYSFYRLSDAVAPTTKPGGYSAIAYSPSTGDYGSASDSVTYADAEKTALEHCQQKDARIVVWAKNAWCALAVADDHAFGFACSGNRDDAERQAWEHCRAHTKSPSHLAVAVFSRGSVDLAPPSTMGRGTYGAIAYSRSTGLFGASRDCATLADAEKLAIAGCTANDAHVVTWAHGAWCALAVAEDRAFGYAWGHSREEVEKAALEHGRHYARTPVHLAVVIDAGGSAKDTETRLGLGTGPLHSVTLRQFPDEGKSVKIDRTENSFASLNVTLPGKSDVMRKDGDIKHIVATLTVLKAGENRPAKYRMFFQTAQKSAEGKTIPLSYQGQTVDYEWTGDRYTLTPQGNAITAKDLEALAHEANRPDLESVIAPNKPVREGEVWSIDMGRFAKTLGNAMQIDESSSTVTGQLVSVTERAGHPIGVIRVDMNIAVTRIGPMTFTKALTGQLTGTLVNAIDGSSPSSTFNQAGEITGNTQVVREGANVPTQATFTYQSTQTRSAAD